MSAVETSFKPRYYAGETARISVEAEGATAVKVVCGSLSFALSKSDGAWTATVPTESLSGRVNWTVFATFEDGSVEAVAHGSFTVMCAGRSQKRDVIDAIDEAIRTWGTNPNRSISVGEISISYKSLDELLAVRAQYVKQAEAEENGTAQSGGVRIVGVRF